MTKNKFFNVLDKNIKQHLTAFNCIAITEDEIKGFGVSIILKIKGQSSLKSSHLKIRLFLLLEHPYSIIEDLAPECALTAYDLQQLVTFCKAIEKELAGGYIDE